MERTPFYPSLTLLLHFSLDATSSRKSSGSPDLGKVPLLWDPQQLSFPVCTGRDGLRHPGMPSVQHRATAEFMKGQSRHPLKDEQEFFVLFSSLALLTGLPPCPGHQGSGSVLHVSPEREGCGLGVCPGWLPPAPGGRLCASLSSVCGGIGLLA